MIPNIAQIIYDLMCGKLNESQAEALFNQHVELARLSGAESLRDDFAATAMQGMLSVPDDQRYGDRADKALTVKQWQNWCVTGLAEHAYRVADAMLKARES